MTNLSAKQKKVRFTKQLYNKEKKDLLELLIKYFNHLNKNELIPYIIYQNIDITYKNLEAFYLNSNISHDEVENDIKEIRKLAKITSGILTKVTQMYDTKTNNYSPLSTKFQWNNDLVLERLNKDFETLSRIKNSANDFPSNFNKPKSKLNQKPIPTPEEISDMEESLPLWLTFVRNDIMRKSLCMRLQCRTIKLSLRAIARILGISHQTVKNYQTIALTEITNELNRRLNIIC